MMHAQFHHLQGALLEGPFRSGGGDRRADDLSDGGQVSVAIGRDDHVPDIRGGDDPLGTALQGDNEAVDVPRRMRVAASPTRASGSMKTAGWLMWSRTVDAMDCLLRRPGGCRRGERPAVRPPCLQAPDRIAPVRPLQAAHAAIRQIKASRRAIVLHDLATPIEVHASRRAASLAAAGAGSFPDKEMRDRDGGNRDHRLRQDQVTTVELAREKAGAPADGRVVSAQEPGWVDRGIEEVAAVEKHRTVRRGVGPVAEVLQFIASQDRQCGAGQRACRKQPPEASGPRPRAHVWDDACRRSKGPHLGQAKPVIGCCATPVVQPVVRWRNAVRAGRCSLGM
jgi:hypothetical protein